jgi:RNA polymerase sigma factor (sigma-70 family)
VEDDLVMQQVRDGDVSKLAVLFDRHHRALFGFFVHLTGSRETSEDLVQEVFLRVLKYRHTYVAETSFRGWLYQIARNVHIDQAGKRRAEVPMPQDANGNIAEFRSSEVQADRRIQAKQDTALLRRALASMPPEKKEVLIMSRFGGLKYEEIASALQCEVGTVKVRVYRALRELGDRFFALQGERAS